MARPRMTLPPAVVPLSQHGGRSLRWRIHRGLRSAILDGQLAPGTRLPSSRTLAEALGVSRSTVVEALDQLAAEGFIDRRRGSGTYISRDLDALPASLRRDGASVGPPVHPYPPRRSMTKTLLPGSDRPAPTTGVTVGAFTPCEPDSRLFPHEQWARALARGAREHRRERDDGHPGGLRRLREALAAHLTLSRGVSADPERIIVTGGARQALHVAAACVIQPGDQVWCEDPGYPTARTMLELNGGTVVCVPVDRDGLDVAAGMHVAPNARAAYVTPSHHFPTGAVLSLNRRLQLLDWATRAGSWIIEDDYDSEFSYGRPLPALQGLNPEAVLYIGTMNKITFAGLRVGYLVAPPAVVDLAHTVSAMMSVTPPPATQAAIADFIAGGPLNRHIIRVRRVYAERQQVLLGELRTRLGAAAEPHQSEIGMNLVVSLHGVDAAHVATRGAARGLDLRPLASYTCRAQSPEALVLGYTHMDADEIRSAVRQFARVLPQGGFPPLCAG